MEQMEHNDAPPEQVVREEPAQETVQQPDNANKPDGWDPVDFATATPEETQKRFDRVYKQTKDLQRFKSEANQILRQQAEVIAQLTEGQQRVIGHLQNEDYSRTESTLRNERDAAFERGDLKAFSAANDKLNEIVIKKTLSEVQKPQPQQPVQPQINSGHDVVAQALESGEITYDDASTYSSWAEERDQTGNLKRPWTNARDPRFRAAMVEGQAVFNNPIFENRSWAEKLAEIDRRMGMNQRQPSQTVMPGGANLTPRGKQTNIKLSPFQEGVALRTKFAGPGKSEAEHLEAYRQQVARAKGASK